jgi:hypothetical protein
VKGGTTQDHIIELLYLCEICRTGDKARCIRNLFHLTPWMGRFRVTKKRIYSKERKRGGAL